MRVIEVNIGSRAKGNTINALVGEAMQSCSLQTSLQVLLILLPAHPPSGRLLVSCNAQVCILMQLDVALSETSCNSARMSVMSPFGPFMQACCHAAVCTGTHPKSGGHSISSELVMLA